jgi:hypothetical protein
MTIFRFEDLAEATIVSAFDFAPVLELADRRDLQSRAHSRRPGPIPGWGTTSPADGNR